jgi:hypothetical protein
MAAGSTQPLTRKTKLMSTTKQDRLLTELTEAKRELRARIAARQGAQPNTNRAREKLCAEMDRKMGLCSNGGTVTREPHQLSISVLGNAAAPKPPKPAPAARAPTQQAGSLYPRATKHSRVTALSAAATELDQRMGFKSAARVRRGPHFLEKSALD